MCFAGVPRLVAVTDSFSKTKGQCRSKATHTLKGSEVRNSWIDHLWTSYFTCLSLGLLIHEMEMDILLMLMLFYGLNELTHVECFNTGQRTLNLK